MKKTQLFVFLLALLPLMVHAQADQKLINKAQQGNTDAMVLLGRYYENGAGVAHDSTLAVKWFQKAADAGNVDGLLYLSRYYLHGTHGFAKDTARYFAIRKEWAEKGNPNAMTALGSAYENGYGCKADSAKAVELYEQAAKKGSSWGALYLAEVYYYGDLLAKDEKKGLALLEKALNLGEFDVCAVLARHYLAENNYKKAWTYLKQGMACADPDAWTVLAEMYYTGEGVEENEARAIQILDSLIAEHHNLRYTQMLAGGFRLTANTPALRDTAAALRILQEGDVRLKSAQCQIQLARYYAGIEDYDAVRQYALKAVDNDNNGISGEACYMLAQLYYYGYGVDSDKEQFVAWMKRGADQYKYVPCAKVLSNYYMQEAQDMPMAVKYLRDADKYGDTEAMAELGQLYANNGNAEQAMECFQQMIDKGQADGYYYLGLLYDQMGDAKTCNKMLEKAEKMGSAYAACSLGVIYENGLDGVKVNYKKAAAYYEKSQTDKALYRLGLMYLNGNVGKQSSEDIAKGLELLNRSAASGYNDAIFALGYCYKTGRNVGAPDYDKAVEYYKYLADRDVAEAQCEMGRMEISRWEGHDPDTIKAMEYYQLASDQDNDEATCYLGYCYKVGNSQVPADGKKALELFAKASNNGSPLGTYHIGKCYMDGTGVEIDTSMAMAYLKDAAAKGVGAAAYEVGQIYNEGLGGYTADADSAIHYFIMGHQHGHGESGYYVGAALINEGATEMAVEVLNASAQRGSVNGGYLLALCLSEGVGVKEPMPKEAYQIFENIVRTSDHAGSYYQLGIATINGTGCPDDENLGKAYLDTAARLGNEDAMLALGQCYLQGVGCNIDTNTAISYLEHVADNGNVRAINMLGGVYQELGDYKNAVLYYEKGVAAGSLESYCNMGYCYQEGLGVVLNSQKAYEMYMFAAEHEYVRGYFMLANCYQQGIYVEASMVEALKWLEKAAEAGNPTAMYYCGSILAEGDEGIPANPKKAREWFKKAAAAGVEAAYSRTK